MKERVRANTHRGRNFNQILGEAARLPDFEVNIEGLGESLVTQAEFMGSAMLVGPAGPQIVVHLIKADPNGERYNGLGLFLTMSPDEARTMGKSLIRMADGGLASVIPEGMVQ